MKMKCLIIVSLILIILTIGVVSAFEDTDDFKTTNQTDDCLSQMGDADVYAVKDDVQTENKKFDDIQSKIDAAGQNDKIYLDGYYKGSGKRILITKSLTFQGRDNAVLDGNN